MDVAPVIDAKAGLATETRKLSLLNSRSLFIAVLLGAGIVYSQYGVLEQPVRGDRANWEYMAQLIVRGAVPYRDAVNIKSPLSAFLGAGAILATKPFGVRDLYAVRFLYLSLAVLTVAFTALVAYEYFGNLRIAALAAMIFLIFGPFAVTNSAGIQPKTPMILFGLISLWAIKRDKPTAAGVFGMLSALCWQPGLLYVGAAGLAFSRYLTAWRDGRVLKLLIGAAAPLLLMIVYFGLNGALGDLYVWTFKFNYSVYAPEELRPISGFFNYLEGRLNSQYRSERIYFILAGFGFAYMVWQELRAVRAQGTRILLTRAPGHAIALTLLVYFGFCMINVQGSADFFPFLPYVAILAALAVGTVIDLTANLVFKRSWTRYRLLARRLATVAALVLVFTFNVSSAFAYQRRGVTLSDQQAQVAEIVSHLEPGDHLFVYGATEVLVISGLTSCSKYFLLDRGKDTYLDHVEPGGFNGWFQRLKAERPKVVLLTRQKKLRNKKYFIDWVESDYEAHRGKLLTYYVRKDRIRDS